MIRRAAIRWPRRVGNWKLGENIERSAYYLYTDFSRNSPLKADVLRKRQENSLERGKSIIL